MGTRGGCSALLRDQGSKCSNQRGKTGHSHLDDPGHFQPAFMAHFTRETPGRGHSLFIKFSNQIHVIDLTQISLGIEVLEALHSAYQILTLWQTSFLSLYLKTKCHLSSCQDLFLEPECSAHQNTVALLMQLMMSTEQVLLWKDLGLEDLPSQLSCP